MIGLKRQGFTAICVSLLALVGGEQIHALHAAPTGESQACFFAGAEAFEALTESAPTAAKARLIANAKAATAKARACRAALNADQSLDLDRIIGRIRKFRVGGNRTQLALDAVEGYRVLVTAQARGASDIPLEVALLDYAGFRYQAGVRAPQPLWSDAQRAVDFADEQWRRLSARVLDAESRASFAADIAAMRRAVDASDSAGAQRAVAAELNKVDQLETYFSRHPNR